MFDHILDKFEAEWSTGKVPDLAAYIASLRMPDDFELMSELLKIDLERRWRSAPKEAPRWTVADYLKALSIRLDSAQIADFIGWEYYVRNCWGDCPTRSEIVSSWPMLAAALNAVLQQTASEIQWPEFVVQSENRVLVKWPLDDVIEVGRQSESDPSPISMVHLSEGKRVIVAERSNPTLSRTQLRIRLKTPVSVQLANPSRNRAIAIVDRGQYDTLDAGQSQCYSLPVKIHLDRSIFLQIAHPNTSDL